MENVKGEHFRGTLKPTNGGHVGFGPETSERGAAELHVTTAGFRVAVIGAQDTLQALPFIYILPLVHHQAG